MLRAIRIICDDHLKPPLAVVPGPSWTDAQRPVSGAGALHLPAPLASFCRLAVRESESESLVERRVVRRYCYLSVVSLTSSDLADGGLVELAATVSVSDHGLFCPSGLASGRYRFRDGLAHLRTFLCVQSPHTLDHLRAADCSHDHISIGHDCGSLTGLDEHHDHLRSASIAVDHRDPSHHRSRLIELFLTGRLKGHELHDELPGGALFLRA